MADDGGVVTDLHRGERFAPALYAVDEVGVVSGAATDLYLAGAHLLAQDIGIAGHQIPAVNVNEYPSIFAHKLHSARGVARTDHPHAVGVHALEPVIEERVPEVAPGFGERAGGLV